MKKDKNKEKHDGSEVLKGLYHWCWIAHTWIAYSMDSLEGAWNLTDRSISYGRTTRIEGDRVNTWNMLQGIVSTLDAWKRLGCISQRQACSSLQWRMCFHDKGQKTSSVRAAQWSPTVNHRRLDRRWDGVARWCQWQLRSQLLFNLFDHPHHSWDQQASPKFKMAALSSDGCTMEW